MSSSTTYFEMHQEKKDVLKKDVLKMDRKLGEYMINTMKCSLQNLGGKHKRVFTAQFFQLFC